jgi:hypothetical protein
MNIPFGRYRGTPLSKLPTDYVEWLLTIELRDPLATAVRDELARRRGRDRRGGEAPPAAERARELIDAGYRALAKRYHPDHGGDLRAMQQLNTAAEWLRRNIEVLH